ncbi:hypothetical protein B0H10DRAFT_1962209 [Mycena sp. CBHHK59/15]|nr:hypothetical protein B0H10DRAFT_1962209 [Mycena sp. CBHHK59/15]
MASMATTAATEDAAVAAADAVTAAMATTQPPLKAPALGTGFVPPVNSVADLYKLDPCLKDSESSFILTGAGLQLNDSKHKSYKNLNIIIFPPQLLHNPTQADSHACQLQTLILLLLLSYPPQNSRYQF